MDAYEATRVVFSRIQAMDPDHAAKIMGLLLLQDHGDKEMIRLAFGPDALLRSLVLRARRDLGLLAWAPAAADDDFKMVGGAPADDGLGWKPCLYYARGFCKNGNNCRFLHAPLTADEAAAAAEQEVLLMRSKSQRFNLLVQQQQQQSESQRAAAAAALMFENENNRFIGRPGLANSSSRQIYLTFPADSTFREEDVSNYFSIYGPVQDVRIPYQQKRMFGFVTFVYPETVRIILAKGNPHFVCDARVLVKPYKEKGKVPDKYRQLVSPRMLPPYDILVRRKMEEQAAAAAELELQQAIEMQGRRFMGLNLFSSPLPVPAPAVEDKSLNTAPATATALPAVNSEDCAPPAAAVTAAPTTTPNEDLSYQESDEHNLPDSPFESPLVGSGGESNGHLLASCKSSCFFPLPRLSSGHGAVGL